MNLKFSYKSSLYITARILTISLLGCDLDETQEVVTLSNLVWEDNFDSGSTAVAINSTNWFLGRISIFKISKDKISIAIIFPNKTFCDKISSVENAIVKMSTKDKS